jgi:hypothetical protein
VRSAVIRPVHAWHFAILGGLLSRAMLAVMAMRGLLALVLMPALMSRLMPLLAGSAIARLRAGLGGGFVGSAAGMAVTGERRGKALAHILHVHIGDRNLATADPRSLALIHRGDHAIIVIGMLQEILRRHAVSGGTGIARELQIFLENLIGVAADPDIRPGAIEGLPLARHSTVAAMAAMLPAMRFALAATATPTIVVSWSHASITSHCCGPG